MRGFKAIFLAGVLLTMSASLWGQSITEIAMQTERTSLSKSISIYPNPAVEYVEVNLDYLQADKVRLTLYNIIGNEMSAETEVIDDHKIRIRVKDLAAGYYLIALRDDEIKFKGTFKFLKR